MKKVYHPCSCGLPSLSQLVTHICEDCKDLYILCVKCQPENPEKVNKEKNMEYWCYKYIQEAVLCIEEKDYQEATDLLKEVLEYGNKKVEEQLG